MATKAGGTGTLVSLVVFVLATVALLVLSIILFRNQSIAEDRAASMKTQLQKVATEAQLQRDEIKRLQAAADKGNKTLVAHMLDEAQAAAGFVSGDRSRTLDELPKVFGLDGDAAGKTSLKAEFERVRAESDQLKAQIAALTKKSEDMTAQMETMRRETDAQVKAKNDEVKGVQDSIKGYQSAAEGYRREVTDAVSGIQKSKDQIEQTYKARIGEMQQQIDALNGERDLLKTRQSEIQRKLSNYELKPKDPSTLVDGRVIDVNGPDNTIFVSLGRADRIQPGMTFEIYETPESIQVDERTGQPVRGKASIQVVKVSETTSTARLTRSNSARPVVKDDVLVNAVYQPGYKYRFLVHGKFDVDGDNRATTDESEFVRSRIREWGGEVVDGSQLTGDMDFLVLGSQPPMPLPLATDATDAQYRAFVEAREAREVYDKLFHDAVEARIPVLNWNRFQILTGQTAR